MIRDDIRKYLAIPDGVLQIPRLLGLLNGRTLVDVTEGRMSYQTEDLPKIHVTITAETSTEETNQFEKRMRSALMSISVYIDSYDPTWRPYDSYYFSDKSQISGTQGQYTEDTKNRLRVDLEEISQELEYRIRRDDPVAYVSGLSGFSLTKVAYSVDETTTPITGIITHDYQLRYFQ